ncbi:cytochrome c biogenesis protein [Salinibaculum rarum]|uniref:cytochrome c biogenesis protein n=1 Tax=Salinibaculum rarum TaxID=3058903 RepID=UPI00265D6759|nr:cytochrome c biogenesis protein CcsA [Salinibaculum sp. KK48]
MNYARLLGKAIRLSRLVTESRVVMWGALVSGLTSLTLVFGFASDVMYGIEHGANLLAYWHIAMAWIAAVALSTTFLGSVLHLRFEGRYWNRLAHSAGELGFLFATLTLVTGSAWGRVIWNSWWEWTDIRLVTFLLVWFVYAGYLVVYSSTERGSDERFAAIYGVVGFLSVPLSYLSTRLWVPTFHETTLANPQVSANIDPLTLVVSIVAVSLLYLYLLGLRVRIHEVEDKIQYRVRDTRDQRR